MVPHVRLQHVCRALLRWVAARPLPQVAATVGVVVAAVVVVVATGAINAASIVGSARPDFVRGPPPCVRAVDVVVALLLLVVLLLCWVAGFQPVALLARRCASFSFDRIMSGGSGDSSSSVIVGLAPACSAKTESDIGSTLLLFSLEFPLSLE